MRRTAALLFLLAALLALPQFLPRFHTYVAAIVLLTALLATSLNLAIGYTGLYQFGHAVFYGVGAYGTALSLTRAGLPATIVFAGTSRVTTLPAPTIAFSPIVTFDRIVEPDPMDAPFLTSVVSTFQSASVCSAPPSVVARG